MDLQNHLWVNQRRASSCKKVVRMNRPHFCIIHHCNFITSLMWRWRKLCKTLMDYLDTIGNLSWIWKPISCVLQRRYKNTPMRIRNPSLNCLRWPRMISHCMETGKKLRRSSSIQIIGNSFLLFVKINKAWY